ncbi:MAG: hypothetical protein H6625_09090 [Bdellovibrionaceae bacterium]|nr:hypothetical protein [Pseudobdellovibrionaceae bacterium]
MRLLRKFYYTTVLTGLLFIFSNLSFPGAGSKYSINNVISEPTEIQSLQDERLSKLNEYTEVNEQEVNEHIETVKGKEGEDIEVSFNPNTGLYIIQNNSYVYIDGKYFPLQYKKI